MTADGGGRREGVRRRDAAVVPLRRRHEALETDDDDTTAEMSPAALEGDRTTQQTEGEQGERARVRAVLSVARRSPGTDLTSRVQV